MENSSREQILKLLNLDNMIDQYLAERKIKTNHNKPFYDKRNSNNSRLCNQKKQLMLTNKNNSSDYLATNKTKLYRTMDSGQGYVKKRTQSASNFHKKKQNTIAYDKVCQSAKKIINQNTLRQSNKKITKYTLSDFNTEAPQNNNINALISNTQDDFQLEQTKKVVQVKAIKTLLPKKNKSPNHIFKSVKLFDGNANQIGQINEGKPVREKIIWNTKKNGTGQYFGSQYLPGKTNHMRRRAALGSKNTQASTKLLKSRYEILKIIGRGLSGVVYKARDILSERYVAIKVIEQKNQKQYEFIQKLSHSNLIQYYNCFEESGYRYLVLQYLPLTLSQAIRKIKLTEQQIYQIFKQIVNAVMYLHSMSYAHRDIKLDNIVVSQDLKSVKFIDFGLCIDVSENDEKQINRFCGTTSYIAPQVIQAQCKDPKQADIWSLGIVLYVLAVGRPPFKGRQQIQIYNKIKSNKIVFPTNISAGVKSLLSKMLNKNPKQRPTIIQVLNHQWITL